ncbi:MAG: hypothetical protein GY797_24070 [Deltaproteobacteria bacterium]|nr:hypothetical protein [Deltaproteobacteria bacterium]
MYEELLSEEEIRRTWELKNYFVVLPPFTTLYENINYKYTDVISKDVTDPYRSMSAKPLSKNKLAEFLHKHNLLKK